MGKDKHKPICEQRHRPGIQFGVLGNPSEQILYRQSSKRQRKSFRNGEVTLCRLQKPGPDKPAGDSGSPEELRLAPKFGKLKSSPSTGDEVPGIHNKLGTSESLSSTGEYREGPICGKAGSNQSLCVCSDSYGSFGTFHGIHSSHSVGQTTFPATPDEHPSKMVTLGASRKTNRAHLRHKKSALVVVGFDQPNRRSSLGLSPGQTSNDGRKCLGSPLGWPDRTGFLVQSRSPDVFKLARNKCHLPQTPILSSVSHVLKHGGPRSKELLKLASQFLSWAERNMASLTAIHVKGSQNLLADLLSRRKVVVAEWSMNQEVFLMVTKAWGQPQIDLFASQQNSKVRMFFSLHTSFHFVALLNLASKPLWKLPSRKNLQTQGTLNHLEAHRLQLTGL